MFNFENENVRKCCFTGYRPAKLPFNVYKRDINYTEFENLLISAILELAQNDCLVFYSGMAMGFDIICAETVIMLKQSLKKPLKLVCAIPFEGQGECFSEHWRERYYCVLENADDTVILSEEYHKGCYAVRNRYMVDNCDYVLTWFDGKSGGTKNTIDYALKKNRFVMNINKDYKIIPENQISFDLS